MKSVSPPARIAGVVPSTLVALALALAAVGCVTDFDLRQIPSRDGGRDGGDGAAADAAVCGACGRDDLCCDGRCVRSGPDHCGDCRTQCLGTTCVGGSCTGACVMGRLDCDSNVVNGCEVAAATDTRNCGACGHACGAGQPCVGGLCQCAPGTLDCDGENANSCEVVAATDARNCGRCGTACGPGQACTDGTCGCAAGRANCDGDATNGCEVDTATDARNCGTCGRDCGANARCAVGLCGCETGYLRCPADAAGGCTVPASSPTNCRACGVVCSGGTPLCTPTGCGSGCGAGEVRCGDSCVNRSTDLNNCGACGTVCSFPNAAATCVAGACQRGGCRPGFGDCDGNPANGCEVDLRVSGANCGRCGNACGTSQSCTAGTCVCPAGQRDCGGGRCAACCGASDCDQSNRCAPQLCTATGCSPQTCAAGTRCCTDRGCLQCCSSADCAALPGHRGCATAGTCTICAQGYFDCNGTAGDGCETNIATDPNNCGACGTRCNSGQCSGGVCRTTTACSGNCGDCDGNPTNGCETSLGSDVQNCGGCGQACSENGAQCCQGTCLVGPILCLPSVDCSGVDA